VSSNENLDKLAAPADEAASDDGTKRQAAGPGGDEAIESESPRARREGGARHTVTESVVLREGARKIEGWALNISRGGLRAVIEESVEVGQEYQLVIGNEGESQTVRVVWVREERGGCIIGVSFLAMPFASVPPPPSEAPILPQIDLAAHRHLPKKDAPTDEDG